MNAVRNRIKEMSEEEKRIFKLIQSQGALTKKELSLYTGMKPTTLFRTMQGLEQDGIITEHQVGDSSGGRKPILYDLTTTRYYCVGIDLSRLYTQIVITNLKMELLYHHRFEMNHLTTPEVTIQQTTDSVEAGMAQQNIKSHQILGVGVGTVGPIDLKNGIMLNPSYFLSEGWEQVPLKSLLEEKLKLPVFVDNGPNAAVLFEAYYGDGKGYQNVAYVNIGAGIRASVVAAGSLIKSINEREDALAHMVIDIQGEKCRCGNAGCVECYATVPAIVKKYHDHRVDQEALQKGQLENQLDAQLEDRLADYQEILQLAEEGDTLAVSEIERAATYLGIALANFIQLLNIDMVILSGPIIQKSKRYYDHCMLTAIGRSPAWIDKERRFSRGGAFEGNAMSLGAASLVLEHSLLEKIITWHESQIR